MGVGKLALEREKRRIMEKCAELKRAIETEKEQSLEGDVLIQYLKDALKNRNKEPLDCFARSREIIDKVISKDSKERKSFDRSEAMNAFNLHSSLLPKQWGIIPLGFYTPQRPAYTGITNTKKFAPSSYNDRHHYWAPFPISNGGSYEDSLNLERERVRGAADTLWDIVLSNPHSKGNFVEMDFGQLKPKHQLRTKRP